MAEADRSLMRVRLGRDGGMGSVTAAVGAGRAAIGALNTIDGRCIDEDLGGDRRSLLGAGVAFERRRGEDQRQQQGADEAHSTKQVAHGLHTWPLPRLPTRVSLSRRRSPSDGC